MSSSPRATPTKPPTRGGCSPRRTTSTRCATPCPVSARCSSPSPRPGPAWHWPVSVAWSCSDSASPTCGAASPLRMMPGSRSTPTRPGTAPSTALWSRCTTITTSPPSTRRSARRSTPPRYAASTASRSSCSPPTPPRKARGRTLPPRRRPRAFARRHDPGGAGGRRSGRRGDPRPDPCGQRRLQQHHHRGGHGQHAHRADQDRGRLLMEHRHERHGVVDQPEPHRQRPGAGGQHLGRHDQRRRPPRWPGPRAWPTCRWPPLTTVRYLSTQAVDGTWTSAASPEMPTNTCRRAVNAYAGNGTAGASPVTAAQPPPPPSTCPSESFEAPDGRVFIADSANNRIRVVATNGTISTYAGGHRRGERLHVHRPGGDAAAERAHAASPSTRPATSTSPTPAPPASARSTPPATSPASPVAGRPPPATPRRCHHRSVLSSPPVSPSTPPAR